jgi:hypothetical protein
MVIFSVYIGLEIWMEVAILWFRILKLNILIQFPVTSILVLKAGFLFSASVGIMDFIGWKFVDDDDEQEEFPVHQFPTTWSCNGWKCHVLLRALRNISWNGFFGSLLIDAKVFWIWQMMITRRFTLSGKRIECHENCSSWINYDKVQCPSFLLIADIWSIKLTQNHFNFDNFLMKRWIWFYIVFSF